MKNYRTLALRELFAQKMTSLLILTAIIRSEERRVGKEC